MLSQTSETRVSWRLVALVGAGFALVAALFASWTARNAGIDDVYITYVYARSFALGHGLTWPGSTALGTSSPFLAVLLGGLSALTGFEVPGLGNAISWLAIAAASTGLFALGRAEGWPWAGFAAGALWLGAGPSHNLLGNEYLPAIAAVIWAFHERARSRLAAAGALLALAVLFRAETGLAAPILAFLELRRADFAASFRRIARIAAVSIVVAGLWLGTLYKLTGHVVPRTFAAKQAQAESALGLWSGNSGWTRALAAPDVVFPESRHSWWWPLALAACVAIVAGRRGPRPASALALIAWGAGHVALVIGIGVPFYPWYAAPLRFAQLLLPTLALAATGVLPEKLRRAWMLACGAALAAVLIAAWPDLHWMRTSPGDARRLAYQRVAELADRYPPGTRIAAWEVGFLGWQSHRPVVDLLGLVSDGASLEAVRRADLRQNLNRLKSDLLMTTLGSANLWTATTGDPRRFLADYRLDQLMLTPGPAVAVYRRVGWEARGEAAIDLLASVAQSYPQAELKWHRAANIGLLSLVLAGGEEARIHLPAGRRRVLSAQLTSTPRRGRLRVRIEAGSVVRDSVQILDASGWTRFDTVVPATEPGATLTFTCLRGKSCQIGQPFLGHPYEPVQKGPKRRRAEGRRPKSDGKTWRP